MTQMVKARAKIKRNAMLYFLLAPGILFFLLFKYMPMFGLVISFKDFNVFTGIMASEWVGLKNFEKLFNMQDFFMVLRNTLVISVGKLVLEFPAPIILAVLLNEIRKTSLKRLFQSIIYLPHFLSWTIIATVLISICSMNGTINLVLRLLGFESVNIMGQSSYFLWMIYLSYIWKSAGWGTVIYLAAMTQIDPGLYEAATIDGASRLQRIIHITLPGLKSIIIVLMIMRVGWLMSAGFEQLLLLQNPVMRDISEIIDTYVYKYGLGQGMYSLAAAMDFFKSIVSLVLITIAHLAAKMMGEEGLW